MSFFAGLNAEKYDRQYTDRQLVRRIVAYFKPQKTRFVWVGILVVAIGALGASLTVIVSRLVDLLKGEPNDRIIAIAGLVLLVIAFANWGLNWARRSLVV